MKLNPFIKKYERDFDAQMKETFEAAKKIADPIKRDNVLLSFGDALNKMYSAGAPVLGAIGNNFANAFLEGVKGLNIFKGKAALQQILTALLRDGIWNTASALRAARKEQGTLRHARKLYRLKKKVARLERKTSKEAVIARQTKAFNAVATKVNAALDATNPATFSSGRHSKPANLASQPGYIILR